MMRGHEKMMSGHEAAKREEDGDKSVEGGGCGGNICGNQMFFHEDLWEIISTVFLKHSLP